MRMHRAAYTVARRTHDTPYQRVRALRPAARTGLGAHARVLPAAPPPRQLPVSAECHVLVSRPRPLPMLRRTLPLLVRARAAALNPSLARARTRGLPDKGRFSIGKSESAIMVRRRAARRVSLSAATSVPQPAAAVQPRACDAPSRASRPARLSAGKGACGTTAASSASGRPRDWQPRAPGPGWMLALAQLRLLS